MMIGETTRLKPTVQIPSWDPLDDPTATISSPFSAVSFNVNGGDCPYSPSPSLESLTSLHCYLPSNESEDDLSTVDAFSCDEFRMYEFKVRRCARGRSHDWTQCPFAHPGEKARRRDPRKYHYSGTACPEFRKGSCRKGEACEFAHGVFECWLHPARYRTQPCKDGVACRRRVCFFAHALEQLRVLPESLRQRFDTYMEKSTTGSFFSSPTSILASPPLSPPTDSPPMSPSFNSHRELAASMRKMHIGSGLGSSRCSMLGSGFCSTPTTSTRTPTRSGLSQCHIWDSACKEEPVMERVESGKELRVKMYARLSKENSLGQVDSSASGPDVAWISELVN